MNLTSQFKGTWLSNLLLLSCSCRLFLLKDKLRGRDREVGSLWRSVAAAAARLVNVRGIVSHCLSTTFGSPVLLDLLYNSNNLEYQIVPANTK